jgi:hypothetical protein
MSYLVMAGSGSNAASASMLQGPVTIHRHGSEATQDKTTSFADSTGPRRITGYSWFCAARDYRDRRSESETTLDLIAAAGYQYIRMFRVLGYDRVDPWGPDVGDSGYFYRRGVSPVWGIDATIAFAHAAADRGLRIQCSAGHQWNSNNERLRWESELWAEVDQDGLSETFFLIEGDNEYWQNANGHNSDEQIALYGQIANIIRGQLHPKPFFACGSAENESPELVRRSFTHSDACEIHTSRDPDKTIKRPFSLWYNEGHIDMYGVPFVHGEPRPPIGPDAFMPCAEPGRIIGAYAMAQLTGGALTYFTGESVRGRSLSNNDMGPLNVTKALGFHDVPRLLSELPQNVADSSHVPGGNIWWWLLPDGRFATVVDELWPGDTLKPPRPIKHSEIIGPNWTVRDGGSRPALNFGDGGALIVGEFA